MSAYALRQTRRFARTYKKLHDNVACDVDAAALAVADNPQLGERKKGDLSDLFVYKFRIEFNTVVSLCSLFVSVNCSRCRNTVVVLRTS